MTEEKQTGEGATVIVQLSILPSCCPVEALGITGILFQFTTWKNRIIFDYLP